jgi:hypothetical protein
MTKLIVTFRISKTEVIPRRLEGGKIVSRRKSFNYVIENYAACILLHTRARAYIYIYIYVCVCVCVCVCYTSE